MTPSTRICLAKYIPDERRWEPRNVGIIVTNTDEIASRFLAEKDAQRIVNDIENYQSWVSYWKRTLTRGDEGLQEILDRTKNSYWIAEAGQVLLGAATPAALVDEYFDQLVR